MGAEVERYKAEFEKLNEYQKKAVTSEEKYMLVNAVVGSGKTTVLVHKVLYLNLIKKIPLEEIVLLTFTNRATKEMKDRLLSFKEELTGELKYLGTFHSVARTILNEAEKLGELGYKNDFEILDNDSAGEMLLQIINDKRLKIKYRAKLLKRIEDFKNGKPLYGVMKNNDDIDELVRLYEEEKHQRNVMDFDDIIENCVKLIQNKEEALLSPKWIIVDEFQDTDLMQLQMISGICGKETRIFCVGDPNQIIYSWRSGTENIFNEFKGIYRPVEISLPLNYRSTKIIIDAANALTYGTSVAGTREQGSKIVIRKHYDAFNEAHFVASEIIKFRETGTDYRNICVLYRRQVQFEILQQVFDSYEIPIKILLKKGLSFEDQGGENVEEGVNLMTLHSSKGLEFSHVFIIGANMGNIPLSSKKSEEPEELRLFYVGITRAKNYLEISYLTKPSFPGVSGFRSSYISMIPSSLLEEQEEGVHHSINELMGMLRDERIKAKEEKVIKALHQKYGTGIITYQDEDLIRVDFGDYGVKEFSKMFCPLEFVE